MNLSGKYIDLWTRKRNSIENKLKIAETKQLLKLTPEEFRNTGNRVKSNYMFNLEYKDGIICNNISGSAVARDLSKVLESSTEILELLKNGHYKINLDSKFHLWIEKK